MNPKYKKITKINNLRVKKINSTLIKAMTMYLSSEVHPKVEMLPL